TDKVACQSCHIPRYARGGHFTKMSWDWSTAGKFAPDGQAIVKKDKAGNVLYHSKKGDMGWAENVVPEYYWYNGGMSYLKATDKISLETTRLELNSLQGDYDDATARIFPFKVMRAKQPFDPVEHTLVVPYLYGKKGSGAYWADFDWEKAAEVGMRESQLPFSGNVGFVESYMYWPITHMVAPKEEALSCEECHRQGDGRLENLKSFYLPGRDRWQLLDRLGWALLGLTCLALLLHAGLRLLGSSRREDAKLNGGKS
ncbi:cytochrome C, partial [bacterium]|nr:cytochrome C [bacterium]